MSATSHESFDSFADFYRLLLREHASAACRRLHFLGCLGALFCLAKLLVTLDPWWLVAGLAWCHGLSWAGHVVFARNHPPALRRPLYGFIGGWLMFRDILIGRLPF